MINGNTKFSDLLEEDSNALRHYNPNHDKDGKFTSGNGGGSSGSSNKNKKRPSAKQVEQASRAAQEGVKTVDSSLSNMENIKGKATYPIKYDKLSDQELNARVARLQKEHQYSDLKGDTKYIKSGKEKAREILQTVGATLGVILSGAMIYEIFRKGGKKK